MAGGPEKGKLAQESLQTKRWIAADGVEIVGEVGGNPKSPAVILLHGGGQTRHSWSAVVQPLCDAGYHVINYDLRGHGQSGWSPDGQYSFSLHAGDLDKVMSQVSGPAAWVGASMGGITAMHAIVRGSRPAALVLVDIVLRPEREGVDRIRKFMLGNPSGFASLDEVADAIAAYNPHRRRPKNPSGLLKNLRLRPDGRYYWHWDPGVIADGPDEYLKDMARMVNGMRAASSVPTLLVRGVESDVVSDASIAEFRDIMPGAEVFDVAEAGHMVAGDSNDAFIAGTLEFLHRRFSVPGRT
jgi:pimeloyl-ACP methyl ester carboxylesterase